MQEAASLFLKSRWQETAEKQTAAICFDGNKLKTTA
jgi:hypothetical protein